MGFKVSVIVLWVFAPLVLALSLWHPVELQRRHAGSFRPQVPGFELVKHLPITPKYVRLLGTADASWRLYRDAAGPQVYVTCVFHESNWKSLHPPHICIRGSNMDIQEDDARTVRVGDRELQIGRVLAVNRATDQPYLSFYAFVGRGFVTHSYLGFFLKHAPRALFRSATPGFLIRIETYVETDGEAAAEERCLRFLRAAIPHGEELIR
ncbi:MAG: exosortase C-terminal domain/associated protein EpsI [Planctomycetota bacterium]|jgi:EpsI family protein